MNPNILIFGSFSGYNLGDKAILMSMVKCLQEKFTIHVPSKKPMNIFDIDNIKSFKTLTAFIGITTLHEVKNTDIVVIGGGGLFFDSKIYNPFFNFLPNMVIIALLCSIFKKKLYIFSVGANHLDSKISRLLTKFVLAQADVITVRDDDSKRVLKCLSKRRIEVYSDPAFLLDGKSNNYVEDIKNKYLNNDIIVLNIHDSLTYRFKMNISEDNFCKRLISIMDEFVNQGYTIFLFSTISKNSFLDKLVEYSNFQEKYVKLDNSKMNPENMIEILKASKLIVGSQLHSLILSSIANVPAIGFIYDEKVFSFLEYTHQKNQSIFLSEVNDLSILRDKINYVLENNESIRAILGERLVDIRRSANQNFTNLEAVLDGGEKY